MKVKELLERLRECDSEAVVVLSRDEEGNGFNTLHTIEKMAYCPERRGVRYRELTPEMKEMGYTEEDVWTTGGEDAVVLWP